MDPHRIEVRRACATDSPQIAALCAELGYPTAGPAIARRLESLAGAVDHLVLVGLVDEVVVGWLHVAVTRALEYEPCAEILGLVVDAPARSSGVGGALVRDAEAWARGLGLGEMRVRSRETRERAHQFYLRAGYEVWKRQVVFRKALRPAP
jgi:GNAT superfamily N-acetyltransferase